MRRPMQEALYEKADAGENLSDRRCRSLPIRHPFRTLSYKSLYQTAASEIVSEYDQEIPQSQTADNPVASPRRAAQPSRDTRKTNQAKQSALSSPSR